MWKYYKWTLCVSKADPLHGKIFSLYRFDPENRQVEKYVGNENWIKPENAGQAYIDIIGAGDGWSNYDIITAEEAEQVKKRLFPEG
ncbi:MAG: hypothetical protein KBB13_00935 [Anaerolineaceae bacterium]|jgi:hypothetical protein|nr:hypothetical protein [Anaerolineaceae bacterium]